MCPRLVAETDTKCWRRISNPGGQQCRLLIGGTIRTRSRRMGLNTYVPGKEAEGKHPAQEKEHQ